MAERVVERIAVLRAGEALGDFIFCLPALEALRAAYPAAEITLLACPWHAALLDGRAAPVDRVIAVPPSTGVREEAGAVEHPHELDRFFERMRAERFDVALQMHGGGRWSNPFVLRLGARLTGGSRAEDAAPLDRWIRYVYFQPERIRCLEIAGLVGAPPVTLSGSLGVAPRDLEEAREYLAGGPFAVLHPGAGSTRRRWDPARFAAVGDRLAEEGLRVVVTGTDAERELVEAVRTAMRARSENACGTLSLAGLAGLLSRAVLVVSNDSGPLHLADAVGAPTVGIFWVGNLVNAAPLGRARHRPVTSFRTACPVCGVENVSDRCAHEASFVEDVALEEVVDVALALLADTRRRQPATPSRTASQSARNA
jgi:ADP-heptose:LPS heptosyltransferase